MDIVLGVSMAPTTVRMVLVEGEDAAGATVDEDGFEVAAAEDAPTCGAPERVIAAILGTRESAEQGDYHLVSTGVTWTDPVEAAILRDALAAHQVDNVMLVSAFLAAAALAQSVGSAVGYAHTGLLFLEPETATLAIVDSADGSIIDVRRRPLPSADSVTELRDLVAHLDASESPPDGVLLVGAGIDIASIKPCLESATTLPVMVPEEPDMALARGAALASAHAPLFVSSTAAVAYAQVPDWTTAGVVDPAAAGVDFGAAGVNGADVVDGRPDTSVEADLYADEYDRKPLLVALGVMTIFFVGVSALVISVGMRARPAVSQQPRVGANLIFPVQEAPAPAPKASKPEPPAPPAAAASIAQQPAPQAQQPARNVVAPAPAPVPAAPAPEAVVPAPVPAAAKPVPVPVVATPAPAAPAPPPEAAAPVPVAPPPAAPPPAPVPVAPVPIPVPVAPAIPILPPIFNPPAQNPLLRPGGGDHERGGWPGGGRDNGGWPPGRGWQPGGDRGGGGWLPGGGGIGGNHGGLGGIGGGGHGGGFGGFGRFGGGHGGR